MQLPIARDTNKYDWAWEGESHVLEIGWRQLHDLFAKFDYEATEIKVGQKNKAYNRLDQVVLYRKI